MKLQKSETEVDGCFVITGTKFYDDRGFFEENYNVLDFAAAGLPPYFFQQNISWSQPNVLRGMHGQRDRPQGKLVRCLRGSIYDVCFDARPGSRTFGKYFGIDLHQENATQLYCPPGTLHGFMVVGGKPALIQYLCTTIYDAPTDGGVNWEALGISWPLRQRPIVSEKDQKLGTLDDWLKLMR